MRQDPLTRLKGLIGTIEEGLARLDALLLAAVREGDRERVQGILALQGRYRVILGEIGALLSAIRKGGTRTWRELAVAHRRLGHQVRRVRWTFLLPRGGAVLAVLLAPVLALLGRAMRPRREPAPPPARPLPLLLIPTTIQPTAAPNAV